MKETPRDWLLARDRDALPRLDALRRAAVAPERASVLDTAAELFRPNLRFWASLALLWLVLVAVHLRISAAAADPLKGAHPLDLALFAVPTNEKLSLLDAHP